MFRRPCFVNEHLRISSSKMEDKTSDLSNTLQNLESLIQKGKLVTDVMNIVQENTKNNKKIEVDKIFKLVSQNIADVHDRPVLKFIMEHEKEIRKSVHFLQDRKRKIAQILKPIKRIKMF